MILLAITIKRVGTLHVRRLSDVQEADNMSRLAFRVTYSAQVIIAEKTFKVNVDNSAA
jgi:hypothetical protein